MLHKNVLVGDGHIIHHWAVADAAALAAITPAGGDIGKVALQLDTKEFYILKDTTPTWALLTYYIANTDALAEGATNKYFTEPRVLGTILAGLSTAAGTVVAATHTALEALGFLQKQASDTSAALSTEVTNRGTAIAGLSTVYQPLDAQLTSLAGLAYAGNALKAVRVNAAEDGFEIGVAVGGGGAYTVADAAPTPTSNGEKWLNSISGKEYTWIIDGDTSQWVELGPIAVPYGQREVLTAARTYYVATTGSDSNNGLGVGVPFLTIQKAVDVVASTLDISTYTVTISCGAGARTELTTLKQLQVTGGSVSIVGDETTPSNCTITTTGSCFNASDNAGPYTISGFKIVINTSGYGLYAGGRGAIVRFKAMDFGACASGHIASNAGSLIEATGNYTISGNAPWHCSAFTGGAVTIQVKTITITGTPTFSFAFAIGQTLGVITLYNNTYSGSATGARYNASTNSVVNTGGGGASVLPGNTAGSTATGAQYA